MGQNILHFNVYSRDLTSMQNPKRKLKMDTWQNVPVIEGGHVRVCVLAKIEKAASACALGADPATPSRKPVP
jgi:hypothetical protein